MLERYQRPHESNEKRKSLRVILNELSQVSRSIKDYYSIRDVRDLTDEEADRVDYLHDLKDEKILDLLIFKKEAHVDDVLVYYRKSRHEEIHPFSMNQVSIYVPSLEKPDELYRIKAELSDIRRNGIAKDSVEALELLEDATVEDEKMPFLLRRTALELISIKSEKLDVIYGKTNRYTIDQLENISAGIIEHRLLGFRGKGLLPPLSDVRVYLFDNGKAEGIMLRHEGRIYNYYHQTPRLTEAVLKNGGYD